MHTHNEGKWSAGLPYINNIWIVLLTLAINLVVAFVFFFGKLITLHSVLLDSIQCGIITAFICVFIVKKRINKLRAQGRLPKKVPVNRMMMKLPKNAVLFSIVFAVIFGLLTPIFNGLVIRFYEIETFEFAHFAVWKILYSYVLSAKIVELVILRYVQPDCSAQTDMPQTSAEEIKDPLPRISTFKQWFNTVTEDFGFNMLFGLLVGGTVIKDHNVIILPTAYYSIVISALILGLIVTIRMVYPIAKSMRDARESGALPIADTETRWIRWMPYSPIKISLVLLVPIMLVSLLVFWAVLSFFDFEILNFFQFFFIRMVFVSILSKLMVKLAIIRYMQPNTGQSERT